MRVMFIAPSAYPLGGVAEWLEYLMHGLQRCEWQCILGLVDGSHNPIQPYLERHPWHETVSIPSTTGSREGRINALARAIAEQHADIVAATNIVDAYGAVRLLRVQGKTKARLVMALHGLRGDMLADITVERDVLDAVIVTNKLALCLARASLGAVERGFYAACGVPTANGALVPHRGQDSPLKLLYCGRLEQDQKRVLDVPDLMVRLREKGVNAVLSIAGAGPDEGVLRAKVAALGLQDDIQFLGALRTHELVGAYRDHHALIITSSWETGPLVAWEAMSHGLPVLSSQYVGSVREGALIDEENCLLFPVGDMEAAASGGERLVAPEMRRRIAQGGLDLVRRRYSRESSVAQWKSAFEQILELPQLPVPRRRSKVTPSGRLDRLLGPRVGERVRRFLGVAFNHIDAGGEWPHTASAHVDQSRWLASASEHDVAE